MKKIFKIKTKDTKIKDFDLSASDIKIVEDAIYNIKRGGKRASIKNVLDELEREMSGFLGANKPKIIEYLKEIGIRDSKLKDTWKHIENYKDVEIYRDDDTGDYGFSHNKGKRLYNTHSKSLEKAKKLIEKDLEFLGLDSKIKDVSEPDIPAKGKWEWDETRNDWYDSGRHKYYTEIMRNYNPFNNRDSSVRDSSNYVIYKSGSDILGTNENNYNTRIQNASEIQNFSRQGFKNVEEVVEYVKKYFKVPGQIIVSDSKLKDGTQDLNYLKMLIDKAKGEKDTKVLKDIVDKWNETIKKMYNAKELGYAVPIDALKLPVSEGRIQPPSMFDYRDVENEYIKTMKGKDSKTYKAVKDADDFISKFLHNTYPTVGEFIDAVGRRYSNYKYHNTSDGGVEVLVDGKRYKVNFKLTNSTRPSEKWEVSSITEVNRDCTYKVTHKDKTYKIKATSRKDAAIKLIKHLKDTSV